MYSVSNEAWDDFLSPYSAPGERLTGPQRARLSYLIKKATKDGTDRPRIMSDFVERFIDAGCPGPTPAEQAENLIALVGDRTLESGQRLDLPEDAFVHIGSPSPSFAGDILTQLLDQGFIAGTKHNFIGGSFKAVNLRLTLEGWQKYEAARRGKFSGSGGFIAMKFGDPTLDHLVEHVVKPAVRGGIGYDLVSMRDVSQAGVIDNLMRAQIRDSAFVLVDLTHDNSGAYWEAGYAEGLGKPVVYICERKKFEAAQTHFDTNHCTTVMWSEDNTDEFRRELVATLRRSLNLFPTS